MPSTIDFAGVGVVSASGDPILDGIDLHAVAGAAIAFIGRSGAGKTTALRLVNGLIVPSRGTVSIDSIPLRDQDLVALRRRIGYMIQSVGLFPHRTVYENVAVVPRLLGWGEDRTRAEATRLLELLAIPLGKYGERMPRRLSGGEQQRVGIARALIAEPSVLLCDEPFAALDPVLRLEQQDALIELRKRTAPTILFVTHDLGEALRIADRIVLFDAGRIVEDRPRQTFLDSEVPVARAFIRTLEIR